MSYKKRLTEAESLYRHENIGDIRCRPLKTNISFLANIGLISDINIGSGYPPFINI